MKNKFKKNILKTKTIIPKKNSEHYQKIVYNKISVHKIRREILKKILYSYVNTVVVSLRKYTLQKIWAGLRTLC